MKKDSIYEDVEDNIILSENDAETLLSKFFIEPINLDLTYFIFENFKSNYLKDDSRKSIFKIAKVYWDKYNKLPSREVFIKMFHNSRFEPNFEDISNDFNEILNYNIKDYDEKFIKDNVIKYVKNKAMYFSILDSAEIIQNNGVLGEVVSKFEKIISMDLNEDLGMDYFNDFDNHCNELLKIDNRTPFGFTKLDKYTYGGLPTSDTCLFMVMAAPGQGKSQFMMNVATNWILNNKKVLVISLEMSEQMYARRFDALFSNLDPNKLRENIQVLKSIIKGIKAGNQKSSLIIKEFPTGTLTCAKLKQYIKKLKSKANFIPDIIFVDYLNIMAPTDSRSNGNMYERCARISEELRAISVELKIPIFSATQANRNSAGGGYAGENIDINNVSESSGITATVDALIALYQLENDRENGRINIKILKNRLGGYVGMKFPIAVDYETLRMTDFPEDTDVNDDILGNAEDVSIDSVIKEKNKNDEFCLNEEI